MCVCECVCVSVCVCVCVCVSPPWALCSSLLWKWAWLSWNVTVFPSLPAQASWWSGPWAWSGPPLRGSGPFRWAAGGAALDLVGQLGAGLVPQQGRCPEVWVLGCLACGRAESAPREARGQQRARSRCLRPHLSHCTLRSPCPAACAERPGQASPQPAASAGLFGAWWLVGAGVWGRLSANFASDPLPSPPLGTWVTYLTSSFRFAPPQNGVTVPPARPKPWTVESVTLHLSAHSRPLAQSQLG